MNCPKCSGEISNVDTFCPSCGEFLKEQEFERKREDHSSPERDVKGAQKAVERAIVSCPRCGQRLGVPKHETSLKVRCPKCGNIFRYDFQAEG